MATFMTISHYGNTERRVVSANIGKGKRNSELFKLGGSWVCGRTSPAVVGSNWANNRQEEIAIKNRLNNKLMGRA